MNFQKIGFIGLGLIGGSIAKKIKANCPETQIYATAHHIETIQEAYKEGIIENSNLLSMSDFSECDCIFLCAPVQRNLDYLAQLKDIIKKDCYITDVGSTKTEIHEEVIRLDMEANFIGGRLRKDRYISCKRCLTGKCILHHYPDCSNSAKRCYGLPGFCCITWLTAVDSRL